MGKLYLINCIISCYCVFLVQCQLTFNQDEENRIIGESLPLILKFVNDDVGATINYNSGKIKHSQLKGDILEVDITTSVSCKSPSEQCNYQSADCRGLLFVKPNLELQVLSVDCNPNSPIEEPIALPVQDKPCEGCLVDINVNGEGVEQLAKNIIQHVETEKGKKYDLIAITKVQTEVTNGVNFYLTALIGRPPHPCLAETCNRDTNEDMYCLVKFFQEPGYYSPKNIISNNCTQTQTFIPMIPKYESNDINLIDSGDEKVKYKEKGIYHKKSEMSENDVLKELMSQIIPSDDSESKSTKTVEPVLVKTVESSSAINLPDGSSQSVVASSTFQEVVATEDQPISVGTDTAVDLGTVESNLGPSTDTVGKESSSPDVVQQIPLDQLGSKIEVTSETVGLQSTTDNNSMPNRRRKRSLVGGKNEIDVNDPKIQEYLGEAVNHLNSNLTEGDSQLKVGKVIAATSQVVSGVSYDIKAQLVDCSKGENSIENCENLPKLCDINVWYRPWLSSRIIKINCEGKTYSFNALEGKSRSKRETMVGGHTPHPIDDTRISRHLGILLPQLDSISEKGHKLKIKKILSATSQVVAGTNWNIKAVVGLSDCEKSDEKPSVNCGDNTESYETICKFEYWEKLPDRNGERKLEEVTIHCEDPELTFRSKREIHQRTIRETLIGGHNPLSNNDPRISKHLQKLLPQLDSISDKEHKLKIKKILSATSQVVAGTNWNIKAIVGLSDCKKSEEKTSADCGDKKESYETICKFKFWEKLPDENGERKLEEVKIDCDDSKLKLRRKRDIHRRTIREALIGGHNPLPEDDPRISKHLRNLLPQLDSVSDKGHKLKIKKIISATSQVVAGTNWNIKAVVGLSDCEKSSEKSSSDCGNNNDSYETICKFKFWEKLPDQNGERKLEEVKINCEDSKLKLRRKRETLIGGHNPLPEGDPRISKHLQNLLPQLDSVSDKGHKLKIKKIISATSQVVAGTNWNIKAVVGLSDCEKSSEKASSDCGNNEDSYETICKFKFWEKLPDQDGERKLDEVKIECDDSKLKLRTKRETLIGGHNPLPKDDPRISKHLQNLLPQLDSVSDKGHKLKIKKIISATSQVVAGTNWNIKAVVGLSDCEKSSEKSSSDCENNKDSYETICKFKFWEKLPDQNGERKLEEVKIECDDSKLKLRRKRETLIGGHNPLPKDDPMISKHLQNLLPQLDSVSDKEHKLKIKKIISATSQVVAGTNWNIKAVVGLSDCEKSSEKSSSDCENNKDSYETICKFKFWEKLPDENGERKLEEVKIECEDSKLKLRRKRETLIGGHNPLPKDDPRISKHLQNLLPQLDTVSDKGHKLKIKKIISATSQVVAGTNWNIQAVVGLSDCEKSSGKSSSDCGNNDDSYETICKFKFWEKLPDENGERKLEEVKIDCEDPKLTFRSKRAIKTEDNIPGGEESVDKSEPELYKFLSESLQHMDLNSPHENKLKVKEILSASRQVVEGYLWRIKVALILSDCNKNDITDWDQCGELQDAEPKYCTIKVWNRPWLPHGQQTNITCDNQRNSYSFRSKRSIKSMHLDSFEEFEKTHNKVYGNPRERFQRFLIFQDNMEQIKLLNDFEQGTAVYGPTKFADWTKKEFSQVLGYRSDLRSENEIEFLNAEIPDIDLPESFDWREKNVVAEVKNQGSCGSCWAFSVTGNVEGQYAIKNGKLLEFSEQELVDCDTVDQGCNGGLMDNAYRQIEKLGGLEEEKNYPYDARDEKCHLNKTLVRVELSGAVNISQDETEMAKWLVKNGPISIAINANAMQFYMGGVSHPWKMLCNPNNLDHGVLIVGYGVHTYPRFKKTLPYWIVKNSWGTSWGEQGYYRVYRGDGTCGVNQTPSSAILK